MNVYKKIVFYFFTYISVVQFGKLFLCFRHPFQERLNQCEANAASMTQRFYDLTSEFRGQLSALTAVKYAPLKSSMYMKDMARDWLIYQRQK